MNIQLRKITFFFILALCSLASFAQENYTSGFTVTLKGDTVKGFINNRNWRKNPKTIQFKKEMGSEPAIFSPADIKGFGFYAAKGIENYTSAKVTIESSSNNIDLMDSKPEFNDREDQLFLLNLLNGSYQLFVYQDEKEHFFVQNGNQISELKFKNYFWREKSTVVKVEQYKTQLIKLFSGCDKITAEEINQMDYRGPEFNKIFKKYDECKGRKSQDVAPQDKVHAVFGIILGTDIAMLKINNGVGRSVDINSAGNFNIGASMSLIFPRNNKSSSLVFELVYRKYKFEDDQTEKVDNTLSYDYHYKFDGNYAKLNVMYRYQWTLAKLKPFINVGISQGFKLSTIENSTTQKTFFTTVTNYPNPLLAEERNYEQGINLGVGIAVKKLSIELRGEATNGYSPYVHTKTAVNSLSLNLNYKL